MGRSTDHELADQRRNDSGQGHQEGLIGADRLSAAAQRTLQGKQGPAGPAGPAGAAGTTVQGSQVEGPAGPQGPRGLQGAPGADGATACEEVIELRRDSADPAQRTTTSTGSCACEDGEQVDRRWLSAQRRRDGEICLSATWTTSVSGFVIGARNLSPRWRAARRMIRTRSIVFVDCMPAGRRKDRAYARRAQGGLERRGIQAISGQARSANDSSGARRRLRSIARAAPRRRCPLAALTARSHEDGPHGRRTRSRTGRRPRAERRP